MKLKTFKGEKGRCLNQFVERYPEKRSYFKLCATVTDCESVASLDSGNAADDQCQAQSDIRAYITGRRFSYILFLLTP